MSYHHVIGLPADGPSEADIAIRLEVMNLLRQRRMTEDAIALWLQSPHKMIGMQVPGTLIDGGHGHEILRLLDDAYHLRSA